MDQQTLEINRSMQEHELTSNENLQLQLTETCSKIEICNSRGGVIPLQYLLFTGSPTTTKKMLDLP